MLSRRNLLSLAGAGIAAAPLSKALAQIGPAPSAATTNPYVSGNTPPALPNWRKSLANVRAGIGRGRLCTLGDSTTAGTGGGTGGAAFTAAFQYSYTRELAQLMSKNITVQDLSLFEDQNIYSYSAYDTRYSAGSQWSGLQSSLAGNMFTFLSGSGSQTLSFTPGGAFNTFTIWYYENSGFGSFTSNVDGGSSLGTVNTGGASQVVSSVTYTVTKGTHTINLVPGNDGNLYIMGFIVQDLSVSAIDIIQLGWGGSTVSSYMSNGQAYYGVQLLSKLAPTLTTVCLTINDANQSTNLTTYATDLQTIITQCLALGDCVLVTGAPSAATQVAPSVQAQYVAVYKSLAASNNIPIIDTHARWTSWEVENGYCPYYDSLHPGQCGYADFAEQLYSALMFI